MAAELLVQFRPQVDATRRRQIIEELGCTLLEEIAPDQICVVACPKGKRPSELIRKFQALPEVLVAEPNAEVELH